MGLSKKDRKYILQNHPSMTVRQLSRKLGAKPAEVLEVLEAAGQKVERRSETATEVSYLKRGKASVVGVMVLVATVSVVYLNSTRNGFHYDDIHSLLKNFGVQVDPARDPASLHLYWRYFVEPDLFSSRPHVAMPRPLLMCTFGFNYMVSAYICDYREARGAPPCASDERGYDPKGWLLLNIIIHGANALIIYLGLCHITGRGRIALLAALLFAVHPINTETVNYINCRSESMTVFFMLLSMYFFTRSLHERKWWMTGVFFVVFSMGLLTKELAFTTIGTLAVIDVLFIYPTAEKRGLRLSEYFRSLFDLVFRNSLSRIIIGDGPRAFMENLTGSDLFSEDTKIDEDRINQRAVTYLTAFAIMAVYMAYRQAVLDTLVVERTVRPLDDNFITQVGVLATYIRLLFLPMHQNISWENKAIEHTWLGFQENPFAALLLPKFLLLIGLVVLAVVWYRKRPLISFVIALFFVTLSITSVVPLNAIMNEHRLYLPSLGPCLLMAFLLDWTALRFNGLWGSQGRYWPVPVQAMAVAIVLLYSALTVQRNYSWHTDLTVWRDSIRNSPTKAQVVSDLGNAYFRGGGDLKGGGKVRRDGKLDDAEKLVIAQTFHTKVPVGDGDKITEETGKVLDELYFKGLHRAELLYQWSIRVDKYYYKAHHNLGTIMYTFSISTRQNWIEKENEARTLENRIKQAGQALVKARDALDEIGREMGEREKAIEAARAAGDEGKALELQLGVSSLEDRRKEAENAVRALGDQISRAEGQLESARKEADALADQGLEELNRAIEHFQQAARISRNGESFNDWGSSIMAIADIERIRTGDEEKVAELWGRAIEAFKFGAQYNPELQKAWVNTALTMFKLGKLKDDKKMIAQALPFLDQAIAINRKDPRPHFYKAELLSDLGRKTEARESVMNCLAVSPNDERCLKMMERLQSGE